MIHLGCAMEWQQPSLVAESLAAACVHENWPKEFLLTTEDYLSRNVSSESQSLLQITKSMQSDPTIANAVKDDDPFNKIADGLMKRVNGEQFARHLSQFKVEPTEEDIQRKLSEMMHTGAYIMGAAQRPGKWEKIDFVLLHNVTLAGYYPGIIGQDWLTLEEKARLLEAKGRVDAVMYAACGCPDLYPERIITYSPKNPTDGWPELFHRAVVYRDEGHAVKLIRALFSLQQHFPELCCDLPIAKHDFIKIAHMAIDSIERSMEPGGTKMPKEVADNMAEHIGHGGEFVVANATRWVFYDGLPKAWDNVPELAEDSKPAKLYYSARD